MLAARLTWGRADWLYGARPAPPPATVGFGLPGVYFAWLVGATLLFFACRWFAEVKRHRRNTWLSYL